MSRGGTDWGTLALLGVGAVVVYELLGKAATSPAPAAPAPTPPTAPNAPTTPQKPPAERGNAADWWTPPALRMPGMVYATAAQPAKVTVTAPQGTITIPATSTTAAQVLAIPAAQPLPLLPSGQTVAQFLSGQPSTQVSTAPQVNNAQDLAVFQSTIQASLPQTPSAPIPQAQPADQPVYADEGDQSRRRMGGAQE